MEVLRCVLGCNNMCSSDAVLQEKDVALRCFKCWMICYDHDDSYDNDDNDDNDGSDATYDLRCVLEYDVVHDCKDNVRSCGNAEMLS